MGDDHPADRSRHDLRDGAVRERFLWSNQIAFWQAPPAFGDALPILGLEAMGVAVAVAARRILSRGVAMSLAALIVAAAALIAALLLDHRQWQLAGLLPDLSGQGASLFALLALEATVLAIAALMTGYTIVRAINCRVTRPTNNMVDLTALFLGYADVQGVAGTIVPRLLDVV